MKGIQWLVILLLAMLESCMPSGEVPRAIAFRSVLSPEQWLPGDEPTYLVVTQKNWSAYYTTPPNGADFITYVYLVASLGVKPNPGYSIKIDRVEQLKDTVNIRVKVGQPDPRKVYPQVIVRPIAAAKVAKADLERRNLLAFVFVDQKGQQLGTMRIEI